MKKRGNCLKSVMLVLLVVLMGCGRNSEIPSSMSQPVPGLEDSVDEMIVESENTNNMDTISQQQINVQIQGFKFLPQELKIKAGTKVTWINMDSAPHNVRSSDKILNSPDLSEGDSWPYTFIKPGVYNYICSIHPSMKAKIIVE